MQQGYYPNYYESMSRIKPVPIPHGNYNSVQGSHMAPKLPTALATTGSPASPTIIRTDYTQGYLKSQIGRRMRVTFLLGTNLVQDRIGVLENVGISYFILKEDENNNLVMCDIYSIKFVNIYK